jgi:SAM-dependent methyltransferase
MNQPPIEDPKAPTFWEARYNDGRDGWDLGQPAPPFVDLLSGSGTPPPGRLFVPGCGRGYDAIWFAQHGFDVTAVDFAETALRDARRNAKSAGVGVQFLRHDLFTLPASFDHSFDYVIEHTCFAAIPLERRRDYVQLVKRLLKPEGLYIALFFTHGNPGGPPFTTTADEIRSLFGNDFVIEKLEPPARSIERRKGQELFALMHVKRDQNNT